jgi:hypothetical protein
MGVTKMAQKPSSMSLNDFVKIHQESFISYELWLIDGLTEYLVAKRDLNKPSVSVIIDIDSENPVHSVDNNSVKFRFNGRFYIPVSDKQNQSVTMTSDQWVELLQQWFDENEVEVVIGEKATDFVKFTAIMSVLELPEQSSTDEGTGGESGEEGQAETPSEELDTPSESPESPEPMSEEPEPEDLETEPEAPTENETSEDDAELKEFEEALGL